MSIGSFFGSIGRALTGHTAQTVAAAAAVGAVKAYNPGLGSIVESVSNAVYAVEAKAAVNGEQPTGGEKKEQVRELIDITAPVTISILSQVAGRTIKDPAAIAPALDKLIDDLVALFNALGIFEKKDNVDTVAQG